MGQHGPGVWFSSAQIARDAGRAGHHLLSGLAGLASALAGMVRGRVSEGLVRDRLRSAANSITDGSIGGHLLDLFACVDWRYDESLGSGNHVTPQGP